jgi:hypothetical protein
MKEAQGKSTDFKCVVCSEGPLFLSPLHGERGGPLMCVRCRVRWDERDRKNRAKRPDMVALLGGTLFRREDPHVLTVELLVDAVALTHPDKHPPERNELAQRVTAELLALKPHLSPKPKPPPEPIVAPDPAGKPSTVDMILDTIQRDQGNICKACFFTTPAFYCDSCRTKWEERQLKKRERRNARRRALRRERRGRCICFGCGEAFRGRRDAKFCCGACRQRAYRRNGSAVLPAGRTM